MGNTKKVKSKHRTSNALYALLPTFKIAKHKYEGWKGTPVMAYFNHWDKGEWVEISWWKYVRLKFWGYKVLKS